MTAAGFSWLFILLFGAGWQPTDLAGLLSPQDYFKAHGIEISPAKMVELAGKDPVDGASQLAQLLALRTLGEDEAFKKSANYQAQRKVLEDIAAGKKAQDKLGFAKEYAQRTLALLDGAPPQTQADPGDRADGLAWFPPSATFVMGIEYKPSPFGGLSKKIGEDLLTKIPEEAKKEFYQAIDSLGNVEIKRITFAYVDEGKGAGRNFARLTGRFNQDWLCEFFKKTAGVGEMEKKEQGGTTITLIGLHSFMPMALVGDRDFLIAGSARPANNDGELIQQALAIREKKQASAASGALKSTLDKIPAKAVGFMAGTFPEEMRTGLGQMFGAFPKTVTARMDRIATGLDFILEGGMDDENQAKTFVQAAGKLRQDALNALQNDAQNAPPGINLDALKNLLNSLQLEPKGVNVHFRLLLSDEAMGTVPYFLFMPGRVQAGAPPQPPQPPPAPNK